MLSLWQFNLQANPLDLTVSTFFPLEFRLKPRNHRTPPRSSRENEKLEHDPYHSDNITPPSPSLLRFPKRNHVEGLPVANPHSRFSRGVLVEDAALPLTHVDLLFAPPGYSPFAIHDPRFDCTPSQPRNLRQKQNPIDCFFLYG